MAVKKIKNKGAPYRAISAGERAIGAQRRRSERSELAEALPKKTLHRGTRDEIGDEGVDGQVGIGPDDAAINARF